MNFQYIKNLINDIKELASSQMIIVILLFAQVSIVTKGLGTIKYGQAVLVLALVAIIFRSLHARNSDVTLLMIQKYGEKMYTRSLFFDLLIGIICYFLCLIIFGSQINTFFGNYSMSFALNFFLLARISQTFSESSKAILTYNGNFKKFALVDTISNLLRFLVIVFLFNSNASIDNYLIGQATFSVTYGIFSLFICREYLIISEISLKNLAEYFTKFKSDFVKQRYDQFVGIVPQHFDLVILGYFTDFSTVGIFRIAKRLIEPINYVVSVLTPYVQNKLSRENQNIRFNKLEELNDADFAQSLSKLGDVYINEAFSCSHRKQASVHKITKFIRSYCGPLFVALEIMQICHAGRSLNTEERAPTTVPSPTVTPGATKTSAAIQTRLPSVMGFGTSGNSGSS